MDLSQIKKEREKRIKDIRKAVKVMLSWRKTDPDKVALLIAKNRVKRGARWLNQHAPLGWWRNCINPSTDGKHARCRIRMSYDNEGVLAIAFEYNATMMNQFGYVTDAMVIRKHPILSKIAIHKAVRMGLVSEYGNECPYSTKHPEVKITTKVLDAAWAHYILNPADGKSINHRHRTPEETNRIKNVLSLSFLPKQRA